MDKAKAAISDFMHKSGHHDTTVHETVAPAVKQETVKPHVHEEVATAIDKEVHQDHYHRTVQPVKDKEILPEQHQHNLGAVQHREFDHRDHDTTKRNLATEQAEFRDQRVVTDTTHSQSAAPTIAGEHVHHHIHETIQPVVHKETIQPSVVHTVVPIHETHHNAAKHHHTSELPVVSMDEYKNRGGVLTGREERYDGFEGQPKHIGGTLSGMLDSNNRDSHHTPSISREKATHGDYDGLDGVNGHGRTTGTSGTGAAGNIRGVEEGGLTGTHHHDHNRTGLNDGTTGTGLTGSNNRTGLNDGTTGTGLTGSHNRTGLEGTTGTGSGLTGNHSDRTGLTGSGVTGDRKGALDRAEHEHGLNKNTSNTTGTTGTKPSLLDRLNPMKDTDGDGKKGVME